MSSIENKVMRRRLAGSYISTLISISLVLLLVGVACMLLVNAGNVSDYFKENMKVSVIMDKEVSDGQAQEFMQTLDSLPFIRKTAFVSKAQGEQEMKEMLGEDFLSVFETSPVPVSIDITLGSEYVSSDSLEVVKARISASPLVDEVVYQQSIIDALNENLGKIALSISVFVGLLLFISVVLISNTVRLNVFSKRFSVHTMRLVGATKSFIRAPFLWQAVVQGLLASLIAIAVLVVGLFVLKDQFAQLFKIFHLETLLMVMGIVVACGVAICSISTYFIVGKLVSLSKSELYA